MTSNNRNPVKQLFITFPKSNVDKHQFRDDLLRFEPDYYKICEEKHEDGTPHLHAVIRFKNKFSKAFVLKYFKEKYPDDYKRIHVKPVRSIKQSIKYLSKEDPNPLESDQSFVENRNPKRSLMFSVARTLGFPSPEALIAHVDEQEQKYNSILKKWHQSKIDHQIPETFHTEKVIDKLLSNNYIGKDDMTLFLKHHKIPH